MNRERNGRKLAQNKWIRKLVSPERDLNELQQKDSSGKEKRHKVGKNSFS